MLTNATVVSPRHPGAILSDHHGWTTTTKRASQDGFTTGSPLRPQLHVYSSPFGLPSSLLLH